jgi:hypothetical protein
MGDDRGKNFKKEKKPEEAPDKKKGEEASAGGGEEEKPYTGVGRYGTAPPLTSHGGRSRVAERKGGKTIQNAVTVGCNAILLKFIGETQME